MLDIKFLLNNKEKVMQHMRNRNERADIITKVLEIYDNYRQVKSTIISMQAERNECSKNRVIFAHKDALNKHIEQEKALKQQIQSIIYTLPNILADDAVLGSVNKVVEKSHDNNQLKQGVPHHEILEAELDTILATKISSARFSIIKQQIAKLARALEAFFLDQNIAAGYEEYNIPHMINKSSLYGSGQLPKFAQEIYKIENTDLYLIPTAEVYLLNIFSDQILDTQANEIKVTASTACFRKEAGAAGKDTKGLIRQHQFQKVELVEITHPNHSEQRLKNMVQHVSKIIRMLDLPYQILELSSEDTGFCAYKTFDIEIWMPGQNKYAEVSSCSNCHEFQARRLKIKNQDKTLAHTLNGSSLPIGRTLAGIVENHYSNGIIKIPRALVSYMQADHIKLEK